MRSQTPSLSTLTFESTIFLDSFNTIPLKSPPSTNTHYWFPKPSRFENGLSGGRVEGIDTKKSEQEMLITNLI